MTKPNKKVREEIIEKIWDLYEVMANLKPKEDKPKLVVMSKKEFEKALQKERIAFYHWAEENTHDMGEMGKFVRLEYLKNWIKKDFPYLRENWVNSLTQNPNRK